MGQDRDDVVGLDSSILMHPRTWEASGHTENFTDELVDCKSCKRRFRADHIGKACPVCGGKEFTESRAFNLMLKTHLGAMEDSSSGVFLRPETAQGIAQIGKSFRNEITPGNFTFRTREFEQMELEYFTRPDEAADCHQRWIDDRFQWYLNNGINKENLRLRPHGDDELAHYSVGCTDIEYEFPFGWSELEGIANRTDFDLKQHAQFSGKDLRYKDNVTQEEFFPYVIEPSGGVDRAALAFLVDAYHEEEVNDAKRVVLRFDKKLAPVKMAVLPLLKKNAEIVAMAKQITKDMQKETVCVYDDTASIGKLYRRQDEIGTLLCVTVDPQSLEDKQVTVRFRDSMDQDRIPAARLKDYVKEKLLL